MNQIKLDPNYIYPVFKVGDKQTAKGKEYLGIKDGMLADVLDPQDWKNGELVISDRMQKVYRIGKVNRLEKNKFLSGQNEYGATIDKGVKSVDIKSYRHSAMFVDFADLGNALKTNLRADKDHGILDLTKVSQILFKDSKDIDFTKRIISDLNAISIGTCTIGTAGDYTTWRLFANDLADLTGDLTATQISDTTETDKSTLTEDLNNHHLKLTANKIINGNPNYGWKSILSVAGKFFFEIQIEGPGTCTFENLYTYSTANRLTLADFQTANVVAAFNLNMHNIMIDGNGMQNFGFHFTTNTPTVKVHNCKIWDSRFSFYSQISGANLTAENITIDNDGHSAYDLADQAVNLNNCVAINSTIADFRNHGNATGNNNASDDGTAANGNWNVGNNNIINITPADEFISTKDTDDNYLNIKRTATIRDAGCTPTIATNTTGMRTNYRPHLDFDGNDKYTIGGDEFFPEYDIAGRFDVSLLPTDTTITSATISLVKKDDNLGASDTLTVQLREITPDWGIHKLDEGVEEDPATNGQATWRRKRDYNGAGGDEFWLSGADFSSSDYGDTIYDSKDVTSSTANYTRLYWECKDLVQKWINNPNSNLGFVFVGTGVDGCNDVVFYSQEEGIEAFRPQLTITYTTPDCVTVFGGVDGADYPNNHKDTYINSGSVHAAYGSDTQLQVAGLGKSSLLRFDLRQIPDYAYIQSAKLKMTYAGGAIAGAVEARRLKVNWGQSQTIEGISESPASSGQATWAAAFDCNGGGAGPDWWRPCYNYRRPITITNNTGGNAVVNTIVAFDMATNALITAGKVRADTKDWRLVYWDGANNTEIARDVYSGWNTANTETWFRLQAQINNGNNDSGYYIYYGCPAESGVPTGLGLSELTLRSQINNTGNMTADYNDDQWSIGQKYTYTPPNTSWFIITKMDLSVASQPGGGTTYLLAPYVFDAAAGNHGNQITNGIGDTKANNSLSVPGFNSFTFSNPHPRPKRAVSYYYSIQPYNDRAGSGLNGYFQVNYKNAGGENYYRINKDGTWNIYSANGEATWKLYGKEAPNDECADSMGAEETPPSADADVPWTSGGNFSSNDYGPNACATNVITGSEVVGDVFTFDITCAVRGCHCGECHNLGWLYNNHGITLLGEDLNSSINFFSKEFASGALRPYLAVQWSTGHILDTTPQYWGDTVCAS